MPADAQTLGGAGGFLLFLTLGCWVLLMACLSSVVGKEVHGDAVVGQGMAWLAAMVLAGLTWLWIGGLLLKAGTEGMMPLGGVALVFYLGSAAAVAAALLLLQDPRRMWPIAVPALIPPILAFYVFALYQPSLRARVAGSVPSAAIWGAVAILSALACQGAIAQLSRSRVAGIAGREARKQWAAQEQERKRAENLPKLQSMAPDAPLWDWLPLLQEDSGVHGEALEAVRRLERRQTDIRDMLGWGVPRAMTLLPELDLKATPELCQAARAYLIKSAKESRVRPKQDPREYRAGGEVENSLTGIRWLMANGCDCDDALAAMQASVETFLDTPDRKAALASLAALRRP
jgi:hypothetical protein